MQKANQRLSEAIVEILKNHRLEGEILISISREIVQRGDFLLDLIWNNNQLEIRAVAKQVERSRMDELVAALRHQALHIIWQHPVRYSNYSHPWIANIACDVAVNQYLSQAPTGTMTLSKLEQIIRKPLQKGQGSEYYLQQLEALSIPEKEHLSQKIKKQVQNQQISDPQKEHLGWTKPGNQLIRAGHVKRIVQKSYSQLDSKQRGVVPQAITTELINSETQYQLPFSHAFWRLMGQTPQGYQPSRARFNRHQPLRLELPGHITRFISQLDVFVDQSGSMSDDTVSKALTMINRLARQADIQILVRAFDAEIQGPVKKVDSSHHLHLQRHGGGGTRYQAIFDYLYDHHVPKRTPIMVITDGWGEDKIQNYGYQRVLWMITGQGDLSVQNVPTKIYRLREVKP